MAKNVKAVPLPSSRSAVSAPWMVTPGTYIEGQAHIDQMDAVAKAMEQAWGVDRLRMLVDVELRTKFDRQRYLVHQALSQGDLETVRRETTRMISAWRALDRAAATAGHGRLSAQVWEIGLPDGRVLALCRSHDDARRVLADGRAVVVWSLEEVAQMIGGGVWLQAVKAEFPGATVTAARTVIGDPLQGLSGSTGKLDDPIPF
jgi:hypothetical protein